jgi:hypothetical protein
MCLNCCNRQSALYNNRQSSFNNNQGCCNYPYNSVNPLYRNYIAGGQCQRGPQGLPGTSDSIYAVATGTITAGELAPLILSVATPTATPTVINNAVNLPKGYYLVSYSASGASTDDIDIGLQLNGSVISNLTSTGAGTIDTSKTLLVQATSASTLTLINQGAQDLTTANTTITVLKVA